MRPRVRIPDEVPVQRRQPTQQRVWPFRETLVPGRGWVRNVPPQPRPRVRLPLKDG